MSWHQCQALVSRRGAQLRLQLQAQASFLSPEAERTQPTIVAEGAELDFTCHVPFVTAFQGSHVWPFELSTSPLQRGGVTALGSFSQGIASNRRHRASSEQAGPSVSVSLLP